MNKNVIDKYKSIIQHTNFIPYFLFTLFVFVYNYFFLHQGYGAHMDEGYLLSLGKRITEGQIPYKDFYFLRPPLSIYLQAFFISVLGDYHSIYIGRIIFVFQTTILVILNSLIYKKFLNKAELFLILIVSYIITTLLLQFQWYSYDGLFFATIALYLIYRKDYTLAGISILLAGIAKQNYFLLLPGVIFVLFLFQSQSLKMRTVFKEQVSKILIGFCISAFATVIFFLFTGNLTLFINQVFLLPKEIASITTTFALIQNNPDAILQSLFSIIALIIIYNFRKNKIISIILIPIILSFMYLKFYTDTKYFIFNIIYINYTVALLYTFNHKKYENKISSLLHTFVPLTIGIQYLAGFSYGGLFFAYMGAGLMVPSLYLILRKNKSFGIQAVIVVVVIGIVGFLHKKSFIYQDSQRSILTSTFESPKLNKILSSERRTNYINFITDKVNQYSEVDDYIFFFSNYAPMYYITDRRNPTKIEWYYKLEYNHEMLLESIEDLKENKPKIIFLDSYCSQADLLEYTTMYYTITDSIEDMRIYLPKSDSTLEIL